MSTVSPTQLNRVGPPLRQPRTTNAPTCPVRDREWGLSGLSISNPTEAPQAKALAGLEGHCQGKPLSRTWRRPRLRPLRGAGSAAAGASTDFSYGRRYEA